jgi:hypothetical protein
MSTNFESPTSHAPTQGPDASPATSSPMSPAPAMVSAAGRPVDRETFAIGVLAVTAAVMFVGLMLSWGPPRTALAIGQNASGGDWLMLTQQVTNQQEAVWVIDAASERIIVFGYDFSRRSLLPLDGFDLRNLPQRDQPAGTPAPGGRRRP